MCIRDSPSTTNPAANPANDFKNTLFDRQQRGRIETGQPKSKINLTFNYAVRSWDFLVRTVRFGQVQFLNNVDPNAINGVTGAYFNDVGFGTDQVFAAKVTTDLVVSYRFCPGITLSAGGNNIFDIYPDRVYIDPRNDPAAVYANPVAGANKAAGGYNASRDASNRGLSLIHI